jgi:hypothetical protein
VCRAPHGHGESSLEQAASFNSSVSPQQESCHNHLFACNSHSGVNFHYHSLLNEKWAKHRLSVFTVVSVR